jgi:hypothetical protein
MGENYEQAQSALPAQRVSDCAPVRRESTASWFWTGQQPDDEIESDRLIGSFDTEQQAQYGAISTLTGSSSVH